VVHEYYDEVVFTDPTEGFHDQLQRLAEARTPRHTLHVCTHVCVVCVRVRPCRVCISLYTHSL